MLQHCLQQSGITIPDKQVGLLEKFIRLFIEKNKQINLTKINDEKEFIIKHIIDSLLVDQLIEIKTGIRIADLGTGGGLPGIPLAILNPKSQFTLIDSIQKKIKCVEEFSSQLDLKNVTGLADRLEAVGQNQNYRQQFDVVVARALAPLPILLELAVPLVKVGGIFVAMKGPNYQIELNESESTFGKLRIQKSEVRSQHYNLPNNMGERHILIFQKNKPTPKGYPRSIGVPKRKPL